MPKYIYERVQESFKEDDRENIFRYMDWLRSTMQDYTQNMRRIATGALLLVALFELVANSRNSSVSIGSFRIARGTVVFDVLPIVVAYLVLQIIIDVNKVDQLQGVFSEAFKIWSEKAKANDLDLLPHGPVPLYWNPTASMTRPGRDNMHMSDKVDIVASFTLSWGLVLAVLAFEAHAYYILLPSPPSVLWFISLGCTLFCLTIGAIGLAAKTG